MILLITFLLSLFTVSTPSDNPKERSLFISPVKIPLALSANFGELRIDHFHSGVDIKTQGVAGKEIVAAASGYVYRISISPGGFGKALYLRHPSGYSTVYGHLDRFAPEIEEYVKSRQYQEKSYMITIWPPRDKFQFSQGEIIAYSGNSGSSSGPHLHYEIRKSDEEIPVNPLLFEFGVKDEVKPVIENLVIYPIGQRSLINNQNKQLKIKVSGGNGKYYISSASKILISGRAGFGLKAYDLFTNSQNKCSIYSLELRIDSISVYNYKMDSFSFNESRYINSHIDYEIYQREKVYIERAYLLPNNKLSVYQNVINKGIYNFTGSGKHHVELIVSDMHNNRSTLSFFVNSVAPDLAGNNVKPAETGTVMMPCNRNNKFISGNVSVNIPTGTLYDTLYFEFRSSESRNDIYSDIYHIHNIYTPVHKRYNLSIKPDLIPPGKATKLLIIQLLDGNRKVPVSSTWDNGYITANPYTFGSFCVGIDTIPPSITANGFMPGANMAGKTSMKIRIRDDLSGIKSYEPIIDGKWALFEYDQKNEMLIYTFDPKRIQKESKHNLSLKVTDNRDNVNIFNCEFIW